MNQQEVQNQEKIKALLVEQLKKTPVIQVACEKLEIARSTFYRWRDQDKDFANAVNESMNQGTEFVSDFAESRLIEAIRDKNLRAIFFWLKAHSSRYATKVELSGRVRVDNEPLTEEQQALIKKALEFSGLIHNNKN